MRGERKAKKRVLIAFLWPRFFFFNFSLAVFRAARQLTEHRTAYGISWQLNSFIYTFSYSRLFTLYQHATMFFKKEEFQDR